MSVSAPAAPRRTLNTVLGRWTMYRFTVWLLLAIAAWSFVLSFAGVLFYTPAELGATAATAVASTLITSRVAGLLLRTRPQTDSSLITGLLLFFLFWPSTEGAQLATVALAGAVATASKYLLVFRRRHIFNPAAVGAFVVAVTGLGGAVWWVATPGMLVVVLPAALLGLYRNRLLPMAGVFAFTAAAVVLARFVTAGESVPDALTTIVLSYPVVFLAGFMLTEPLTLPPLRVQRLVEAAVVGVLFAVPLSLGPVMMSPELALLAGNALAFAMGQRGAVRLRLRETRDLTPTSRELVFEPSRPVRFRAGQYLELAVPHFEPDSRGSRRIFSITTAPSEPGTVAVGLRVAEPGSSFKTALLRLRPGAEIGATTVAGDFLLPRDARTPMLMIASGIGITPFISQLREVRGEERDIVLVYAASSADELAYAAELQELDVRVLVCMPSDPGIPGWTWLGPGLPDSDVLREKVPDVGDRAVYVSGSPQAVAAARKAVRGAGGRRIRTDPFLGY
ncbi:FAD-dependent oxidoreductase [Arthrobacter sp. zg-Y877]|uniref:FAD-dependent oxidoreductase n=1 Tax=Arthrobacter sp. zg-Y877 TaxID=3049074 RepID=UPI0025A3F4C7|nr:FAD-dependent oxidoreductase [Arthrobacter sp. zg-Y877]MDM7989737.1 FAD-dependent oxidoreductase [Arthrobacter sp. zg-Y877]